MTAEQVLEYLDYIDANEATLQPVFDWWEETAVLRQLGKINHCSIKDRSKYTRDLLTGTTKPYHPQHIGKTVEVWMNHIPTFTLVGDLLVPHVNTNVKWYNVQILRSLLCFAKNYIPPLDRAKIPEGHCKNTGLPTHFMHKGGKQIKGVKKADCCPCPACEKLRWERNEERTEATKRRKTPKKKKDPMRYK